MPIHSFPRLAQQHRAWTLLTPYGLLTERILSRLAEALTHWRESELSHQTGSANKLL